MPTILYVHGWRLFLLERGQRADAHSSGEGRCGVQVLLHPDRFEIVEEFEYNCTPPLATRGTPDRL
jgi:hypothetical protein